jgi:hypothetical protein
MQKEEMVSGLSRPAIRTAASNKDLKTERRKKVEVR